MPSIGTVLIAKNEEADIGRCLQSLLWMDEIVVVDDCSTDRTVEIAKSYGAKVVVHPLKNFSDQRNLGIDESTSEWLFHPDADMVMSSELAEELKRTLETPEFEVYACYLDNYWLGNLMRYGGWRSKPRKMIARRHIRFQNAIHEMLDYTGPIGVLLHHLRHDTDKNYRDRLEKSNRYTNILAQEDYDKGKRFHLFHFIFYPWALGIRLYILRAGFRDGLVGFFYFLHVIFINYVQMIKLWEIERDTNLPHSS